MSETLKNNDAAVPATSMICNCSQKQAWWRQVAVAVADLMLSKSKIIVVRCTLCTEHIESF